MRFWINPDEAAISKYSLVVPAKAGTHPDAMPDFQMVAILYQS
jgi:hypothetical protein